ncbi:hypothetical protein I4U23_001984 [Adineta vaga]|nr:hypothetical protein I4U23_001984 [Adineta vaga]
MTNISNSFNPPLVRQLKSPLPAISNQQNRQSSSSASLTTDEIDLVLPTKVFKAKKTSVNDLSQAACSYLWFRRIKEIFLVMGKQNDAFTRFDMELARTDMIRTCEQYLESERPKGGGINLNSEEQTKLDRWKNKRLYAETFRMSYFRNDTDLNEKSVKFQKLASTELSGGEIPHFDNAIWWYSCNEAPIFDQMNNILRLENFELLMCHRYYISDLCQTIEQSYLQWKSSEKLTVYRADKLSRIDFEIIEKSKGQKDAMITINGFISTSKDEKISLEYAAAKLKKRGNDIVIMYEITIDPAILCSSFADIESISFHPREREILFNMGSTFQIDDIVADETNPEIKRIKLTAKDFNLTLLDEMKAKVKQSSQATLSILLIRYLIELGEDRVSKRYLNQLIDSKQLDNDPNLVSVYNCLGLIYSRQALYGEALDYYRKALNAQARIQFSNNNALAEIFNYIGQAHIGLNQLDEAQQNLEEGIRIQKREPKHVQQHLASLYCNLGQVAYARHDYVEAEKNFQSSYDLYNRNTKISHDALEKRLLKGDLCIAFGQLKSVQNRKISTDAKEKFEEALQIYESTLPSSHPKVAEAHIGIVCEYARNKNFQSVIQYQDEHFLQLLKDYELKQTTNQQDLANLYAIIGACFAHEKEFDKAMEYWKIGIEHEHKVFLDQLLSSARTTKIELPHRLVDSAIRIVFDHYLKIDDAPRDYLAILYAKMFVYDKVVESLRGQSSFLLAHTCIAQRNFKGSMIVYRRLLESKNVDITLIIGVLLRMLKLKQSISNDEPITELLRFDKLLVNRGLDNEAIRLRMIINDSLAEMFLLLKKDDDALRYSRISYELKQRHYSSNHPSLVRNCKLAALRSFQRKDYKTAAQNYERAIEIQLDNMSSNHIDIRSTYFLMGDCYCLMNRTELANEFYDRAQASNDVDADDTKEVESDIPALIRMYSNLAKMFSEQKDFASASTQQQEAIDLLIEIIPTFVVKLIEEEDASSMTFDQIQTLLNSRLGLINGRTFAQVLRNYVFIYLSLGRTLLFNDERTDDDKDSTDLYEQAIELHSKLAMFEKLDEQRSAILYEELSKAYTKLYPSMTETIQQNLLKSLEEITDTFRQRSLEYRLGNLYLNESEYSDADQYWNRALKKTKTTETIIKKILEKLIEKNKDNLPSPDDDDDDEEEEEEDEEEKDNETDDENNEEHSRPQSNKSQRSETMKSERPVSQKSELTISQKSQRPVSSKSQRRLSTKSILYKEKPEELAHAYLDLEDYETALKYFKKYAAKLQDTLKPSWPDIEIEDEQILVIKYFHSQLIEIIDSTEPALDKCEEITNSNLWINLLHAYTNIFKLSVQLNSSSNEISKANIITFEICQKLYDIPDHLCKLNDILFNNESDDLQWKELLTLLSSNEANNILMRIAAYYTSKEQYDDSLEVYRALQNFEGSNSAVNYGLLKLLEEYISADEEYRQMIMTIDFRSSNIPIFDRILLCRLIISFWEELEDETMIVQFKKELFSLQNKPWIIDDLETTDCIGHILSKVEDYTLARLYWNELLDLYNEMLPESIVTRLYASNFMFAQLFQTTQQMTNELYEQICSLAENYKLLGDYEEMDEFYDDAREALNKAIVIWKKIPSATDKIDELQIRLNDLKTE